jgi:hypothetical protein
MSRPISIPKLTHHKASGKAVVRLSGIDVYCGVFGTTEAKSAYDRAIAEWLARGRVPEPCRGSRATAESTKPGISVNEILVGFWKYAEQHYRRPDGTMTNEVNEYKQTLRLVQELYGLISARVFGPVALKAVRQEMISRQWCRGLINQRINRVRRVFKWAAGEELIPFEVFERLTAVTGVQKGRCAAPESDPVEPVADFVVEATLQHLNRYVRGLVEFQRSPGADPGKPVEFGGAISIWAVRSGSTDPISTRQRGGASRE